MVKLKMKKKMKKIKKTAVIFSTSLSLAIIIPENLGGMLSY